MKIAPLINMSALLFVILVNSAQALAASESLTHELNGIFESKYREPCDERFKPFQLAVAAALDLRAKEIDGLALNSYETKNWRVIRLGDAFVRERKNVPHPKSGWQKDKESWESLEKRYNKIKDQPTNQAWVDLSSDVRSILVDDEDRLIYHVDVYLKKENLAFLQEIEEILSRCLESSNCGPNLFSGRELKVLQNNPFYAKNFETKNFEALLYGVRMDLWDKNFRMNQQVRRVSETEIVVPLDAGAFRGMENQIAEYIESGSSPRLSVKIKWVDSTQEGGYRFVLDEGPGGRSFVAREDYVRSRAIAHEIGHVLGFRDYYYTTWFPNKCTYVSLNSESDLMSSSGTGSVTQEEWDELNRAYPYAQ